MEKHEKELYENALQMIDELQEKEERKDKIINDLLERIANLEREVERLENKIQKAEERLEPIILLDNDIMVKGRMLKPILEELGSDKE